MAHLRIFGGLLVFIGICAVAGPAFRSSPVRGSAQETVALAAGSTIALTTPAFIQKGHRYAFTWPGGGPVQTFTVKDIRRDGWILVEVAEENVDPAFVPLGSIPTRWLNAALATSIQEMRPFLY